MNKNEIFTINIGGIDNAKRMAHWGTYGADGTLPLKFVRLIDYSTDHLKKIVDTQNIGDDYRTIINAILEDRK